MESQEIPQSYTAQQTSHKNLLGKTEGGCLCSGEKQQRTKWEEGLYKVSPGAEFSRVEIFKVGIGGVSNSVTGRFLNSRIGGNWSPGTGEFSSPRTDLRFLALHPQTITHFLRLSLHLGCIFTTASPVL